MLSISIRTSGSAFSLILSPAEVCLINKCSNPTSGNGGRLRNISPVIRWKPRLRDCKSNSTCFHILINQSTISAKYDSICRCKNAERYFEVPCHLWPHRLCLKWRKCTPVYLAKGSLRRFENQVRLVLYGLLQVLCLMPHNVLRLLQ